MQIYNEGSHLDWYLALIEELITGNDGLVNAAHIHTSTAWKNCPVVKLYSLEINTLETPTTDDHDQQIYLAANDIQNPR